MAFTQRLALIIDAKTAGATSQLKSLNKEVSALERNTNRAGTSTKTLGAQLGITKGHVLAAGAAFAIGFGVKAVEAGSHLNETISKTNVLFGDSSKALQAFAADSSASLGLSKQQALDATATFGGLFLTIGKGQKEAAELGTELATLAADLASFNDTSVDQAITALASGLRGENEPLRQFNILLDDATLKNEALKLGLITTTTQALTPAAKAQAAYSAILGQSTAAQGDFERTSEGLAGQTKILKAEISNLVAEIGDKLVPVVTDAVSFFNTLIDKVKELNKASDTELDKGPDRFQRIRDYNLTSDAAHDLADAFGFLKEKSKDVDRALGLPVDNVNLNLQAFDRAAKKVREFEKAEFEANQQAIVLTNGLGAAAAQANATNSRLASLAHQALVLAGGLGVAAAQANAVRGALNSITLTSNDPFANFIPEATVQLASFADSFASTIGNATSGGVGAGLEDAEDAVDDFGDYLQAVAEDRLSKLDNVFAGLSSKLSFDDAATSLQEATDKLAALKAEAGSLKGDIAGQRSLVGQLLAESLTITPTEQVAIEQAEKHLADTLARFQGTVTQATAPSSSFLGPTTIDVFNAPTASLAELQVAEERLAEAKADAVGPTRALEDAEKKLADLRERQADLPKLIADANRDLTRAQLALVDAQRQLNDAGQTLIDQGPEFVTWFETIARQAGLSGAALANFAANLREAMRIGGGAKGLVDVFGNGTMFRTPSEANDILSWISGQSGGPRIDRFAGGGTVPGFPGQPQLVLAHGGEQISRVGTSGGAAPITINVTAGMGADGQAIARYVHQELLALQRRSGKLGLN